MYKDNISFFEELLKNDKSFCIYHRNIQSLAIEPFKVKNNLSSRIMCDIFGTKNFDYNLRSQIDFRRTRVKTSCFGLNSLKYLVRKILDIVPYGIMSAVNLNSFKKKMRNWKPKACHCRLCELYVHGVGYLDTF